MSSQIGTVFRTPFIFFLFFSFFCHLCCYDDRKKGKTTTKNSSHLPVVLTLLYWWLFTCFLRNSKNHREPIKFVGAHFREFQPWELVNAFQSPANHAGSLRTTQPYEISRQHGRWLFFICPVNQNGYIRAKPALGRSRKIVQLSESSRILLPPPPKAPPLLKRPTPSAGTHSSPSPHSDHKYFSRSRLPCHCPP